MEIWNTLKNVAFSAGQSIDQPILFGIFYQNVFKKASILFIKWFETVMMMNHHWWWHDLVPVLWGAAPSDAANLVTGQSSVLNRLSFFKMFSFKWWWRGWHVLVPVLLGGGPVRPGQFSDWQKTSGSHGKMGSPVRNRSNWCTKAPDPKPK